MDPRDDYGGLDGSAAFWTLGKLAGVMLAVCLPIAVGVFVWYVHTNHRHYVTCCGIDRGELDYTSEPGPMPRVVE